MRRWIRPLPVSAARDFRVFETPDLADRLAARLMAKTRAGVTPRELAAVIRAELANGEMSQPGPHREPQQAAAKDARWATWKPRITWLRLHPRSGVISNELRLFRGFDGNGDAVIMVDGQLQAVPPDMFVEEC